MFDAIFHLLCDLTPVIGVLAVCAWSADRVPESWVTAFAKVLER